MYGVVGLIVWLLGLGERASLRSVVCVAATRTLVGVVLGLASRRSLVFETDSIAEAIDEPIVLVPAGVCWIDVVPELGLPAVSHVVELSPQAYGAYRSDLVALIGRASIRLGDVERGREGSLTLYGVGFGSVTAVFLASWTASARSSSLTMPMSKQLSVRKVENHSLRRSAWKLTMASSPWL